MPLKPTDFLFISILTLGTSASLVCASMSKKIGSALLAGITGGAARLYIVNSKKQLESKLDNLIDSFDDNRSLNKLIQLQAGNLNSLSATSTTLDPINFLNGAIACNLVC